MIIKKGLESENDEKERERYDFREPINIIKEEN